MVAKKRKSAKVQAKKKGVKIASSAGAVRPLVLAKAEEINTKLASLQREEEDALVALLQENEAITRNTVGVEMEIKRQKLMTKELTEARVVLERGLRALTSENGKIQKGKKELERDVKSLEAENSKLGTDIASLSKNNSELESQNKLMKAEKEKHEATSDRLREDVARLRKLKEDYLKSIAKFKEMREDLIP